MTTPERGGRPEGEAERPSSPGVRFPPPVLFVGGFLLGWLLHRAYALPIVTGGRPSWMMLLGWAALAAGLGLLLWGLATFVRARTAIFPNRPASRIVTTGPYRFTRNPMYVGLTTAYVGLSLLANSVWPVAVLPVVLGLLTALVIQREERYLSSAFGAEYDEYARRVGRWV